MASATDHGEALAAFSAAGSSEKIPAELKEVLNEVGLTGKCRYPWAQMIPLIEAKINEVCAEYHAATQDLEAHGESYAETLKRLHALLQEFPNPPFTLQRLVELLVDPHRIYRTSTRKLMHALEKLLTVSSTDPVMVIQPTKPGTYQAVAEYDLAKIAAGDYPTQEAAPMDVDGGA